MIENFKVEKREIDRIGKFSEKEKILELRTLIFSMKTVSLIKESKTGNFLILNK